MNRFLPSEQEPVFHHGPLEAKFIWIVSVFGYLISLGVVTLLKGSFPNLRAPVNPLYKDTSRIPKDDPLWILMLVGFLTLLGIHVLLDFIFDGQSDVGNLIFLALGTWVCFRLWKPNKAKHD